MTDFIFCLIFIQVSIFLIVGFLLATSVIMGFLDRESASPSASRQRSRAQRPIYTPEPLSRNEIEYLLGS